MDPDFYVILSYVVHFKYSLKEEIIHSVWGVEQKKEDIRCANKVF